MERIFVFRKTFGSSERLTFANGGYIIKIKPIAIGIFVVPLLAEFMIFGKVGIKYPIPTPKAIAIKIQRVKFLSRKLNFLVWAIFKIEFAKKRKIIQWLFADCIHCIFQLSRYIVKCFWVFKSYLDTFFCSCNKWTTFVCLRAGHNCCKFRFRVKIII